MTVSSHQGLVIASVAALGSFPAACGNVCVKCCPGLRRLLYCHDTFIYGSLCRYYLIFGFLVCFLLMHLMILRETGVPFRGGAAALPFIPASSCSHRTPVRGVGGRRGRGRGREWCLRSGGIVFCGAAAPPGGARGVVCGVQPPRAAPCPPQEGAGRENETSQFFRNARHAVSALAALPRLHETTRRGGVWGERSR